MDERKAVRCLFAQGYAYAWRPAEGETDPISVERGRRSVEAVPKMMEIWESEYQPEIEALCRALQSPDVASMSLQELATRMEGYVADSART